MRSCRHNYLDKAKLRNGICDVDVRLKYIRACKKRTTQGWVLPDSAKPVTKTA